MTHSAEPKEKRCPVCGAAFMCHHHTITECWCTRVKLTQNQIKQLSDNYNGCLCPDCINKLIEKEAK